MQEYIQAVKDTASEGKRTVGQLLLESAVLTHKLAVDSIRQGARTGRLYGRWGNKKIHQASAPGEAPKSDTGALLQNLTLEKEGANGYTVGSRKGAPWGFWLEFGTSKMGARPWLVPAFTKMIGAISGKYK